MLYDEPLSSKDGLISKLPACCRATAGAPSEIDDAPQVPTIPPRELMRQTIDLYNKTVNDLIAQGYPKQMAEMAAKKYILDE